MIIPSEEPEAVKVLRTAISIQLKKSKDYQNPNSSVRQADYYRRGVDSILDICNAKYLRILSVLEAMENDPSYESNFESIEDSAIDAINYYSFLVAYCRGKIDGQDPHHDILNRKTEGYATPGDDVGLADITGDGECLK